MTQSRSENHGLRVHNDVSIAQPVSIHYDKNNLLICRNKDETPVLQQYENVSISVQILPLHEGKVIKDPFEECDELQELNDRLHNLTSYLQTVREEERTNIAREVHDELGQQMTSLKLDIAWMKDNIDPESTHLIEKNDNMLVKINKAIRTVRKIITTLRPGVLDDLGLVAAIEWQANEFEQRTGIVCVLRTRMSRETFSEEINIAIFRIFQEALNNVLRHAEATKVRAKLYEENNLLVMEIIDNGVGITDERKNNKTSFGLLGMKERMAMLQGSFEISKLMLGGTRVKVEVPLSAL
jgi:signal transduction histidine kinase